MHDHVQEALPPMSTVLRRDDDDDALATPATRLGPDVAVTTAGLLVATRGESISGFVRIWNMTTTTMMMKEK